jgi:aromatic-L-amino-acid/L-tryptophan decarboxylase
MSGRHPLELSEAEMRDLVDRAMDRIMAHIGSLGSQPAARTEGGAALARELAEPLPERPTPVPEILDLLFEKVVPCSFNTAGPGYLAYIPGGGLFHAAVADLIADATNRYVGVFQAAPGLAQIEANVVRWFCEMAGLGEGAGGFLTTGGSLANLTAVTTARHEKLGESFLRGTLYTSDQTHHSVHKAARLAGLPPSAVREIPSDGEFRVRVDVMAERMDADRAEGLRPFLICANAGTTNTGAVDHLDALADLAAASGAWLHVDAAYGGFFALTGRGKARLRGMHRADSITLDPHKGLFLPYGTGCLLARDAGALRRTHALHADYLPDMQRDSDLVDFCEISPELSRDPRGLRVWLPLKMHGVQVFRDSLEEKLDLAAWAAERLREIPGIEILAAPQLSIVAFRLAPPGAASGTLDRINRELLARVNAGGRVYLTATTLRDGFAIRICVLSFRTHQDRMQEALDAVRAAAASLFRGRELP